MKRFYFSLVALVTVVTMTTSCGSDTVDGDKEYFTQGQLVLSMEDESSMYFIGNDDGQAMVTYDRSNPIHLNESNSAKITTYVGNVVVPEVFSVDGKSYTVTAVDEMAFANNTSLTSLSLPNTIMVLGKGAFANCSAMTSVNIPSLIERIPSSCFAQCKKMSKMEIPVAVKSIGTLAFANCTKMSVLSLPEGLETIAERAFLGCSSLREITLPSTVNSLGGNAFLQTSKLTKVHVRATTPPELSDSLGNYISKATLYVPMGTKESYAAHHLWNKFKSIIEE